MPTISNEDLMTELRALRTGTDKLVERLYGDLDDPYEEAAIPRILRTQTKLDERIDVLEKDRIKVYTITSILSGVFGWVANYFIHGKH